MRRVQIPDARHSDYAVIAEHGYEPLIIMMDMMNYDGGNMGIRKIMVIGA